MLRMGTKTLAPRDFRPYRGFRPGATMVGTTHSSDERRPGTMGIRVLTRDECLQLLGQVPIGRIALSINALPAIYPVNFELLGESVFFGAMAGSRLALAINGNIVAFQADSYDLDQHCGWTVMGVGHSKRVDVADDLQRLVSGVPEPWVLGHTAAQLVEVKLASLSGHAID